MPPTPGRPGTGDLDESKEVAPELNLIGMRVEPVWVDDVARALGKDPLAVREANFYGVDERNVYRWKQILKKAS